MNDFAAWRDSLSSAGCIIIHPMPYVLHSVFKKLCFLGPNKANTGDDSTPSFNSSNRVINCDVQESVGIGFQKWILQSFLSGFNTIAKYGAHIKYKSNIPINKWKICLVYGSLQYLIMLNLYCAGVLPSCVMLCPPYST